MVSSDRQKYRPMPSKTTKQMMNVTSVGIVIEVTHAALCYVPPMISSSAARQAGSTMQRKIRSSLPVFSMY